MIKNKYLNIGIVYPVMNMNSVYDKLSDTVAEQQSLPYNSYTIEYIICTNYDYWEIPFNVSPYLS